MDTKDESAGGKSGAVVQDQSELKWLPLKARTGIQTRLMNLLYENSVTGEHLLQATDTDLLPNTDPSVPTIAHQLRAFPAGLVLQKIDTAMSMLVLQYEDKQHIIKNMAEEVRNNVISHIDELVTRLTRRLYQISRPNVAIEVRTSTDFWARQSSNKLFLLQKPIRSSLYDEYTSGDGKAYQINCSGGIVQLGEYVLPAQSEYFHKLTILKDAKRGNSVSPIHIDQTRFSVTIVK